MIDSKGTLMEALGIELVSADPGRVVATMPVDERTRQPFGYLHGGAESALLETVASVGALQYCDPATEVPFAAEFTVRFLRSAREGTVTGEATPARIEPGHHVWDVVCRTAEGEVLSEGTCTIRVVKRR